MTTLSLREAARTTGTSRSTLLRRIQTSQLAAARTEEGVYAIDLDELLRVCPPKGEDQDGPKSLAVRKAHLVDAQQDLDSRLHLARLEAELEAMKAALESERSRCDELREERDRWHAQAERLAVVVSAPAPQAEPARPVDRGLKFLRWAKLDAAH